MARIDARQPALEPRTAGSGERVYEVRNGDSLWSIARQHGLSNIEPLLEANPRLRNSPSLIKAGWRLVIPRAGAAAPQASPEPKPAAAVDTSTAGRPKDREEVTRAAAQRAAAPPPAPTRDAIAPAHAAGVRTRPSTSSARDTAPRSGLPSGSSAQASPGGAPRLDLEGLRPRRALRAGNRGLGVELAQRLLNRAGYRVDVDGGFDRNMVAVVKQFQKDHGISTTGYIGPQTFASLEAKALAASAPAQVPVTVSRGALSGQEARNAFDLALTLAWDDPRGLASLLEALGIERGGGLVVDETLVQRLSESMRELGMPLTDANLEPLRRLRAQPDQPSYEEAASIVWLATSARSNKRMLQPTRYDRFILEATANRDHPGLGALAKAYMFAESGYDPGATSDAGARGLMQLMPATADIVKRELRAMGISVSGIDDPRSNTIMGVHYLDDLLDRFDGDIVLATAGYNAGPSRVARTGSVPPFWETARHVRKTMALYSYYLATGQPAGGSRPSRQV